MSAGSVLQGRDQDRKLRINLLYNTMGVLGVFKRDLRWFKSILVVFFNEKTRKIQYQKFHFCSDHIFAGHNEDRGTSWVVILGWLS